MLGSGDKREKLKVRLHSGSLWPLYTYPFPSAEGLGPEDSVGGTLKGA